MSEERFDRLENKIDAVKDTLARIDTTLALQHASLEQHIHRTELLEQTVVPLQKRANQATGVLKFIGLIGVLAAIAEGIFTCLSYFRK